MIPYWHGSKLEPRRPLLAAPRVACASNAVVPAGRPSRLSHCRSSAAAECRGWRSARLSTSMRTTTRAVVGTSSSIRPIAGSAVSSPASRYQSAGGIMPPWVTVRRFWCDAVLCRRRIFAERFGADVLAPLSRRTGRLETIVHHLGLALGGRPAAAFADRLMMPVSNDTLLRVVRRRTEQPRDKLAIIGIDVALTGIAEPVVALWKRRSSPRSAMKRSARPHRSSPRHPRCLLPARKIRPGPRSP